MKELPLDVDARILTGIADDSLTASTRDERAAADHEFVGVIEHVEPMGFRVKCRICGQPNVDARHTRYLDRHQREVISESVQKVQAHLSEIDAMVMQPVAPARRVSAYLLAVMDVSNAAHDHKATCAHNCNVSLNGLRRAAQFLAALVDDRERDEAERIVNAMPRF